MFKTHTISFLLATFTRATATTIPYAGINIAGFDFGCQTDGTCPVASAYPPIGSGPDGIGQMKHFANDDKLNIFRLLVSWQYLVNGNLGSTLNPTNWAKYDQLIQGCLATGANCVIDVSYPSKQSKGKAKKCNRFITVRNS